MRVFIHTYCRQNYAAIILDKIKKFKDSGLWNNIDILSIPVSGMRDIDKEFFEDLSNLSKKIEIFEHNNPTFNSEPDTLNYIKSQAQNFEKNTPILYTHTKGVSHNHPILKKNINAWVRYLDLYTIAKWEECIEALNNHDVAGGLYVENPKHFSGNFWWANSDYIKTLPTLDLKNIKEYNRGEFWICSNTEKIYPVSMNGPIDLYQNYYLNESDFIKGF